MENECHGLSLYQSSSSFFMCFFFYLFSKKLFCLRSDCTLASKLALVSSFLFLFYPFHSEALFWIVGRGAILCTLFGLLCFFFYLQKERNIVYYLLSLLFFAAALLSYEEAWIIPVIIVLLSMLYQAQSKRASILQPAIFWLIFLVYIFGRYLFTHSFIGTPYGSERMMDFNPLLLCKNFTALVFRSVVIPMQSSFVFSITCAIVAIIFFTIIILIRRKINLVVIVSIVCFLISLLPVIPLGIDTHDTESERFLYFPSLFFLIFMVQVFDLFLKKKAWLVSVVFMAEIVVLLQSYNSFALSSRICRATMTAISKEGSVDTIYCSHLPEQYKGAFIFRNGFESAVNLVKKDSIQHIVILSTSELFHPEKNYQTAINAISQNSLMNDLSDESNLFIEWTEKEVILNRYSFK